MTIYDTRHTTDQGVERTPASFLADDGRELRGTWFTPARETRGAVLVVPAMATPSSFYDAFATWLAESGFVALTFDYRGMESREAMVAETGDVVRWAGDAASALEALLEQVPAGLPVTWVGHSLGGQVLPFARHDLLGAAVLVSSGSGHWRLNSPGVRWRAPFLWRVIAPLAIRAAGYFPGRRLGVVGDLPAGVMRQWGRWCLSADYLGVDVPDAMARFAEVELPVSTLHFTDDELLSGASMRTLEGWYAGASLQARRLAPADLGVDRVGHHGFFRAAFRPAWEEHVLPRLATAP